MADNLHHMSDYRQKAPTPKDGGGLKGGSGDGTFDDMEARVARLEKAFEKIEGKIDSLTAQVTDLRVGLATVTERVAHLPTKEFIWKGIAGLIAAMAAIATLAPKLQQLFGIIPK